MFRTGRVAVAVALLFTVVLATPAGAASQITSIQFTSVNVLAAANCALSDHIVDYSIVVEGVAGPPGTFDLSQTLGGSGVPVNYLNTVADSLLGVPLNGFNGAPGLATTFNGTGWTTLNGTAVISITANGVGPATITIDCATRAFTIKDFSSVTVSAVPATDAWALAFLALALAGLGAWLTRRRTV